MCLNRSLKIKINRLHKRCLRIVYNDKISNFNELLVKDGSVSITNLQKLSVKMFKVSRELGPEIVNGLFQSESKYLIRIKTRISVSCPFDSFRF